MGEVPGESARIPRQLGMVGADDLLLSRVGEIDDPLQYDREAEDRPRTLWLSDRGARVAEQRRSPRA